MGLRGPVPPHFFWKLVNKGLLAPTFQECGYVVPLHYLTHFATSELALIVLVHNQFFFLIYFFILKTVKVSNQSKNWGKIPFSLFKKKIAFDSFCHLLAEFDNFSNHFFLLIYFFILKNSQSFNQSKEWGIIPFPFQKKK